MNMIKKEQKREKARRKTLLQAQTPEEKEKLQALHDKQRKDAKRRIEAVNKDRQMLLEKHHEKLILGLEPTLFLLFLD